MSAPAEILIPLIVVPTAAFIPILAIWTSHQRRMAEIKARAANVQGPVLDEVRTQLMAMREDIASLRDTTTRFDMSFDAAVSRLEQRVDRLEEGSVIVPSAPSAAYPVTTGPPEAERVVLGQRG